MTALREKKVMLSVGVEGATLSSPVGCGLPSGGGGTAGGAAGARVRDLCSLSYTLTAGTQSALRNVPCRVYPCTRSPSYALKDVSATLYEVANITNSYNPLTRGF